jgi:hypothetical protein
MSRFRAAGIHLLISLVIVISVLSLMLGLWYPGAYFKLMGGGGLLFILALVDISLGPLLTLAIFKPGKKGLKLDLALIGAVQLAALLYGVSVMFQVRPVFTVLVVDQFRIATPVDIEPQELERASRPEWQEFSLTGPILVASRMPEDPQEREKLIFAGVMGIDLHQFPHVYVHYADQREAALKKAKPLSELRKVMEANNLVVDKFLSTQSRPEEDFVFLPIRTKFAEMAAVLDAQDGDLVEIIDAQP